MSDQEQLQNLYGELTESLKGIVDILVRKEVDRRLEHMRGYIDIEVKRAVEGERAKVGLEDKKIVIETVDEFVDLFREKGVTWLRLYMTRKEFEEMVKKVAKAINQAKYDTGVKVMEERWRKKECTQEEIAQANKRYRIRIEYLESIFMSYSGLDNGHQLLY